MKNTTKRDYFRKNYQHEDIKKMEKLVYESVAKEILESKEEHNRSELSTGTSCRNDTIVRT